MSTSGDFYEHQQRFGRDGDQLIVRCDAKLPSRCIYCNSNSSVTEMHVRLGSAKFEVLADDAKNVAAKAAIYAVILLACTYGMSTGLGVEQKTAIISSIIMAAICAPVAWFASRKSKNAGGVRFYASVCGTHGGKRFWFKAMAIVIPLAIFFVGGAYVVIKADSWVAIFVPIVLAFIAGVAIVLLGGRGYKFRGAKYFGKYAVVEGAGAAFLESLPAAYVPSELAQTNSMR